MNGVSLQVCLPYVPATPTQVHNVMHQLKGRSGSLVDLGSGDGRIVSSIVFGLTYICKVPGGSAEPPGIGSGIWCVTETAWVRY